MLWLVAACGAEEGPRTSSGDERSAVGTTDSVVDADGRIHVLGEVPLRIVSLVPSATETLLALGTGDRLVGRTDFDTARAVAHLPSVGGGLQPSMEVLLSLEPDLVIRFSGETDVETPQLLQEAAIPHLSVRPERIEDVRAMIRTLGRVTRRQGAADSILAHQDRVLADIRARTEGVEPVPVVFTLGGDSPFVAGPATYVGELLAIAGGRNVFADLGRPWGGVSPEAVVARSPELLLTPQGTRLDPRITRGRRVARVPPFVQLPGPHLARAALVIARAIHPHLFGDDLADLSTDPTPSGADSAGPTQVGSAGVGTVGPRAP